MSTRWYIRTATGTEFGPYSGTQLRKLAARGKVVAETLVRREEMAEPVPARRIATLLPPPSVAVTLPPPPLTALPEALPTPLPASELPARMFTPPA